MNRRFLIWIGCALFLLVTNIGFAGILVTPNIINFMPNTLPRKDIMVMNNGTTNAYVRITPSLVIKPGTKFEKRVVLHDPAKMGLLVSPNRFIIPPKQHRILRLMQVAKRGKVDKIYRITVAPVPNKLMPVHIYHVHQRKIGVRVVIAYGVLAIVRPNNLMPRLVVKRSGRSLMIANKGNTNIVVVDGKQCLNKKCFKLSARRMYAGNIWKVKLPLARPVVLTTDFMGSKRQVTSN